RRRRDGVGFRRDFLVQPVRRYRRGDVLRLLLRRQDGRRHGQGFRYRFRRRRRWDRRGLGRDIGYNRIGGGGRRRAQRWHDLRIRRGDRFRRGRKRGLRYRRRLFLVLLAEGKDLL